MALSHEANAPFSPPDSLRVPTPYLSATHSEASPVVDGINTSSDPYARQKPNNNPGSAKDLYYESASFTIDRVLSTIQYEPTDSHDKVNNSQSKFIPPETSSGISSPYIHSKPLGTRGPESNIPNWQAMSPMGNQNIYTAYGSSPNTYTQPFVPNQAMPQWGNQDTYEARGARSKSVSYYPASGMQPFPAMSPYRWGNQNGYGGIYQPAMATYVHDARPQSLGERSTTTRPDNHPSTASPGTKQIKFQDERSDKALPQASFSWVLEVYGQSRKLTPEKILKYKEYNIIGILQNSLNPLTDRLQAANINMIENQAAKFFSAFDPSAQWYINIDSLPPHIGNIISGVTSNSRKTDIGSRFMRFRFPLVFFEVSTITPPAPTESLKDHWSSTAIWRAWVKEGANAGLAAYGRVHDEISWSEWKIVKRTFEVIQVTQPELFTPVPYPRDPPVSSYRNDLMIFSTSWTVIRFLRKSQSVMIFLVTISALFAALQPVVGHFTPLGGFILAGIGILSGLVSLMAFFVGWVLGYVESHAAQQRQSHPEILPAVL
ncbi:hypothetical protein BDQ17DRAFT_1541022 [Cyathus striatus]|nr:hypothetical protein BDQ17DRAFT_1541022 [Cyathus striatus]